MKHLLFAFAVLGAACPSTPGEYCEKWRATGTVTPAQQQYCRSVQNTAMDNSLKANVGGQHRQLLFFKDSLGLYHRLLCVDYGAGSLLMYSTTDPRSGGAALTFTPSRCPK